MRSHHVVLAFSIHSKCVKKWNFKIEDFGCFWSSITFFFKSKFFWSDRISLNSLESSKNRNNFWVIQSYTRLYHQKKEEKCTTKSVFVMTFTTPYKIHIHFVIASTWDSINDNNMTRNRQKWSNDSACESWFGFLFVRINVTVTIFTLLNVLHWIINLHYKWVRIFPFLHARYNVIRNMTCDCFVYYNYNECSNTWCSKRYMDYINNQCVCCVM